MIDMNIAIFALKASGSWRKESENSTGFVPAGFVISCKNPVIHTDRYDTIDKAFLSFQKDLNLYVKMLIPTGDPIITIEPPVYSGRSIVCKEELGEYIMRVDPEYLAVSWTITIGNHPNQTLDEFDTTDNKN